MDDKKRRSVRRFCWLPQANKQPDGTRLREAPGPPAWPCLPTARAASQRAQRTRQRMQGTRRWRGRAGWEPGPAQLLSTPRPSRHKTNTKPTAADNSLRCAPMASAGVERPSIPSHLHGSSIYVGWGLLAQAPPSPSPQRLVRSSSSLPSPLNWSAGPWSRQKANWGSQHDGTDC